MSAASLIELFRVRYSPRGSSRRALEESAVGHWHDWLIDVKGGDAAIEEEGRESLTLSSEEVLVFASGASAIPSFGFRETPCIEFLHSTLNGWRWVYPDANTCTLILKLPLQSNYEDFGRHMLLGVIQSPTFGVA